MGRPVR